MRIAVLNDSSFAEVHLARLRRLGPLTVHGDTVSQAQAVSRLADVDVALVDGFKMPLDRAVIESGTQLRLLALNSTAFHMVDLDAARARGVKVCNVPGYSTEAVAEHALALLLAVVRNIAHGDAEMRAGPFQIDAADSRHRRYVGFELRGSTLGVIGLGAIGRRVAELGNALGMRVLGWNRTPRSIEHVSFVSLERLLRDSDVVSLHLAVTPQTENLISQRELDFMRPGAVLINTADGRIVDTQALFRALQSERLAGAGLDVLADWDIANPLLGLASVVLSPLAGAATREAGRTLADMVVANVEAFVRGRPINLVD